MAKYRCEGSEYKKDGAMVKRSINAMITVTIATTSMFMLMGCDNPAKTTDNTVDVATTPTAQATSTPVNSDQAGTVDWAKVASAEQPATVADYKYPFAIDSQNVQNYADYFKVDKATAQHNLTISTASNEALSKVLDQLGNSYTSHQMTDGRDAKLVIHTTADIAASRYDYVFAEPFAKGLVLPIEIVPDGVKSEVDVHLDSH